MALANAKKLLVLLVVAFVIYAIVQSPQQAADIVHTVWNMIVSGFRGIADFFNKVLHS
ncbi:hypothetical protein [Branchiibius sp. NY16-3462-2]|uniref:hypothetical protein n=1 Tax=Branchiibius sp. NY16-3462-2 TaxID=1807500 RepID=UPI0025C558F4|nr:hypothetical protein [Branchiibius sp. NY16-3462-2]